MFKPESCQKKLQGGFSFEKNGIKHGLGIYWNKHEVYTV